MAGDTPITVIGNLTADPELRFTPSGHAVASFTVASTPRHFDKQSNEWVDDEALFMRCSIWRQQAENVAEGLTRGTRVVASGRLVQRSFETREGEKRTIIEMQCDEVAASLKYATVRVTRTSRGGQTAGPASASDPWGSDPTWGSTPANVGAGELGTAPAGGQGDFTDEPPF